MKDQSLAPSFYATKQELFRCDSSAIADERRGYLQRFHTAQKLTNEWDGQTHDYTRKSGVVHAEILLPAHAPPAFQDRSTLWNSVEAIEKLGKAQLAREIEIALPVELDRAANGARSAARNTTLTQGASKSRTAKAAGRTTAPTPPIGTTRTRPNSGGRRGPSMPTEHWSRPEGRSELTTAATSAKAWSSYPPSTWAWPPPAWSSAAFPPTRATSTGRSPQTTSS